MPFEFTAFRRRTLQPADTRTDPMPLWKRSIDVSLCLVALPVLAFFTVIIAVSSRFVSPGPVFFRQTRIGLRGSKFGIYKFRTMKVNADTAVHQNYFKDLMHSRAPMVKLDTHDNRLIPGGWLLRVTGIDELPQVINVLRGEMSFVGPRPCIPTEYENYLPWQKERSDAVPGLTGLWQVSGKNRTTFEQMIAFDIQYARTVNFWQDVRIILLTVPALVQQVRDSRKLSKSAAPFSAVPFAPSRSGTNYRASA
jgi:exopolysaccharide production protein ExoY